MKFRNIFIAGLSVVALASCSDYLEVDAPSQNVPEYVYSDKTEMNNALNGIYTSMLSSDTYGDKMYSTYVMNTDVDFKTNSSRFLSGSAWSRYDADPDGGAINSTWAAQYATIELANLFVEGAESSPLYDPEEKTDYADIQQMIGEAKVMRAIAYHDLTWMFGDVPFSFNSSRTTTERVYPITDRAEVLDKVIEDLKEISENMKFASELSDGVERISKEMAWAMIARIAQTAAGYTLRPDGDTYGKMERMNPNNYLDYYAIARDYAKKVIDSQKHTLGKPFYQVFYDQGRFMVATGDDIIWEIPFAKTANGRVGYDHGPKLASYQSETPHNYGEAKSNNRLNAAYSFMFNENDARRDYVNQLTQYDAPNGDAIIDNTYTVSNGKWSKLWVPGGLGNQTTDNTGINFPFMRYTDVLLMFAEAVNEIEHGVNGPNGAEAVSALAQVRRRAFPNNPELVDPYIAARTSEEDFRKAVLDERKFEFAGENMRWRDLVRHDLLAENVYWTFYRYLSLAEASESSSTNLGHVSAYDFDGDDEAYDKFPFTYHNIRSVDNKMTVDGVETPIYPESVFPNQNVKVCRVLNPYRTMSSAEVNGLGLSNVRQDIVEWSKEGNIRNEIRFSLRGYIYMTPEEGDENGPGGVVVINTNGKYAMDVRDLANKPDRTNLPVIRYILPIPRAVLSRSEGRYQNYYGYK
ncbi:MAG: RagB/SusD family nutrient uptake outer membrane protein [Duncaniella sp.]|nr:RagB/SusD family nutrient uptake outer membrane protein [Duncaniella sp.]